jgi:hypothetical protein
MSDNNTSTLSTFKKKAQRHIYYLQMIMFAFMVILYEFKFVNQSQALIIIFIILFNIAFTQNMLNNFIQSNQN